MYLLHDPKEMGRFRQAASAAPVIMFYFGCTSVLAFSLLIMLSV
jgi:hypothetical protein